MNFNFKEALTISSSLLTPPLQSHLYTYKVRLIICVDLPPYLQPSLCGSSAFPRLLIPHFSSFLLSLHYLTPLLLPSLPHCPHPLVQASPEPSADPPLLSASFPLARSDIRRHSVIVLSLPFCMVPSDPIVKLLPPSSLRLQEIPLSPNHSVPIIPFPSLDVSFFSFSSPISFLYQSTLPVSFSHSIKLHQFPVLQALVLSPASPSGSSNHYPLS